ncbi:MAG: hypothetical protein ACRDQ5_21475, partial [Sciscionella sp.]
PSRRQRVLAALAYAGRQALVTGVDALSRCGVPLPESESEPVHLLLPAARRMNSRQFVLIERTTRLPAPIVVDGIGCAPPARAALDAARLERDQRRLDMLLGEPVRRGACTLPELRHELDSGSQRGSAAPRTLLIRMSSHVHSLAEHQARRVVAECPIPQPCWSVPLRDAGGALLGVVDAWWEEVGLVWDVGGAHAFRHASGPARELRNQALTANRVLVLRTNTTTLFNDPQRVRRSLAEAYLRASDRPRPDVRGGIGPAPSREQSRAH